MQQLLGNGLVTRWYFAMGAPEKTSLSIQYCRENGYNYFSSPSIQQLQKSQTNCIIEGPFQLFQQLQKIKPELHLIFFGTDLSNEKQRLLRREYLSIGYCENVPVLEHAACRKALYPNLIFVYGPIKEQNEAAAQTLARNMMYNYSLLPNDHNDLIKHTNKTRNYVINGLFTSPQKINILSQYFNIHIIHFKYNRQDLPKYSEYFDQQHDLLKFLTSKPYYYEIKGDDDPVLIMDNVGVRLCPRLLFINYDKNQHRKYVEQYVEETDGLILSIYSIQHIRKRKGLPIAKDFNGKLERLNQIIYKDLNRKQLIFTDFPWHTPQFISLENLNRKFTSFIDLTNPQKYTYSKQYSSPIYFLQNQTRISPSFDLSLKEELVDRIEYWIVNGPGTCGKTAVAKYVAAEFGYKLVEWEVECGLAKEKIAAPEDGDQVPVKKYVAYFANMIKNNPQITYIFDNLPYTNADLQLWISQIGCPNVINLKVEPNQLIKRARKKAQFDVNAQITEEQTAKANENIQKNGEWVEKVGEYGPASKIYQVDYNLPQILSEPYINSILRPRIFLTQRNIHLVYQNIAIRHNMGFINLAKIPLRECGPLVRKCGKRDIILCYYGQSDEKLVSDDMYWIEKNLGEIRYLGIWQPEEIEIKEHLMKLERPPEPVKAKPVEGEEEEPAVAEGEQDGKPKKVFDIYEHQWSEPVDHKNLSQWYFKLKKKITKKTSHPKSCYNTFQEILDALNKDKNQNFYQIIN